MRRLIENKRKWHRAGRTLASPDEPGSPTPPTKVGVPGAGGTLASAGSSPFLGWHERGYLPHFDAPNVTQFVTFMLRDAFPVTRRPEWESVLQEPDESARRHKLEAWLDRGHGECWLRQPKVAGVVEAALREKDGSRYRLQAWCIMPNHVHLVVDVWNTPLSELLKLWKGGSARSANIALHRRGSFWEREYFDTLIRGEAHLGRAVRYTEANPVKANLAQERRAWRWSSARLRDEHERLSWQRAAG